MSAEHDFSDVAPFTVHAPAEQRVPYLFNSPHSGRYYPERFLAMTRLGRHAIRRSEDSYVDVLMAGVTALGAPLLAANFPRAYLDVNREPWELDQRMFADPLPPQANMRSVRVAGGLGTVPRLVGEGQYIYAGRIPVSEALTRVEFLYKPYHRRLRQLMLTTHDRFGVAVVVDCHSMPASIRTGETGKSPDFIIGDRFGTSASAALSDHAMSLLKGLGYTVAYNKPYAGGFITEHYGRPARRLHALQLEINRGLYVDEGTLEPTAGFDVLKADLMRFAADLMALPEEWLLPSPLAAE